MGTFMRVDIIIRIKSVNVASLTKAAKKRRKWQTRSDYYFGCNPCSEIILRPYQFCNLTEVVVEKRMIETLKIKLD